MTSLIRIQGAATAPANPQAMSGRAETTGKVGRDLLERAVALALRAPSVHNTQPWRWRVRRTEVELHADPTRHLVDTDPGRRDLLISCGAALHHLRVAVAGLGAAVDVEYLPDPENEQHLATVRLVDGRPDPSAAALFGQLERRHSDRRPYSAQAVPAGRLAALVSRAARHGVLALPVIDPTVLHRVNEVLRSAAREQRRVPGCLAELLLWTHRYANAHDGVPRGAVPTRTGLWDQPHLQRFPAGTLAPCRGSGTSGGTDGGTLLLLATPRDDAAARLAAGEALSAVLLAATRAGLATAPLSQAVELPSTRTRLCAALRMPDEPQILIRIGVPLPGAAPLAPTPRRPLASVLLRP
ncbi:NAD(P)H nitroreductase [Pseudonocardia sp. RS11V-5]|uniref:Acg family FMN-binding oxidoreductase n=1 Tax=Pseudonocardia terrae TaxID=2905831 RepID=UPI001E52CE16|nr:NAD(P)H nitroreductase [Pseudonocardia terrae]MCE3555673.1 NAD(P)H nitroreductase [Pseudonocardia terrae]